MASLSHIPRSAASRNRLTVGDEEDVLGPLPGRHSFYSSRDDISGSEIGRQSSLWAPSPTRSSRHRRRATLDEQSAKEAFESLADLPHGNSLAAPSASISHILPPSGKRIVRRKKRVVGTVARSSRSRLDIHRETSSVSSTGSDEAKRLPIKTNSHRRGSGALPPKLDRVASGRRCTARTHEGGSSEEGTGSSEEVDFSKLQAFSKMRVSSNTKSVFKDRSGF